MKIARSSCRGGACFSLLLLKAFFLGSVVGSLTKDTTSLEKDYSFEWFVEKFRRVYDSSEEHQHRQHVFESNLRRVTEHNQDSTNTYKLGINHFMDLENHELPFGYDKAIHHRHHNNNKNWFQDDDLSTTKRSLYEVEEMPFALDPVSELPSSVDWREAGVVSPVKNQGGCGSCWAFATIEGLESHLALQTGILFSLSMQQLVSCSPNPHHCGGLGGCLGSIAQLGYDHVAANGIVEEWSFSYDSFHGERIDCPYDQPPQPQQQPLVLQKDDASSSSSLASTTRKHLYAGAVATIEGYATTPVNNYTAVMNAVAKHGPIVVSVAASHWGLYKGGVFDPHHNDASAYDMNHAVLLVGYGTDDETGQDYWLVRNSWGPRWGEKGYIRLKRQDPATMDDPESDCGMDVTPSDGDACSRDDNGNPIDPPDMKVCGTSGVYYMGVFPVGGSLAD